MEILFNQKFKYANISLLKDYCKLVDFQKYKYDSNQYDCFDDTKIFSIDLYGEYRKSKNSTFFREEELYANPHRFAKFEMALQHYTLSDNQIKRNYNNPFASVRIEIFERTIKKRGDSIIVNSYYYTKGRGFNEKYFRNHTIKAIFSFNLKTGNFNTIEISQSGKIKSAKKFRTNSFIALNTIIYSTPGIFNIPTWKDKNFKKNKKIQQELQKSLDNKEFYDALAKSLSIDSFLLSTKNRETMFLKKIMEKFIELKKIKTPDSNYEHFLTYAYPTEIYFKKNDRKLVASVLDLYKIKSKFTIKLIHKYPYLNLIAITNLCMLLGNKYQKYLSAINEDVFSLSQSLEKKQNFYSPSYRNDFARKISHFYIKDNEKENLIKIVNDIKTRAPISDEMISDFYDHFLMIHKIRYHDNRVELKAQNHKDFQDEHMELTKLLSIIRKGWCIEYIFDEKTIHEIEKPIKIRQDENVEKVFFPLILKRDEDYVEEGNYMHHCVATYSDKDTSMIISIRDENNKDRVTCEINKQNGKLIQAKYFCNSAPPKDFELPIEEIIDKSIYLARLGLLNHLKKEKVPIKINGIEIKPKTNQTIIDELENGLFF